MCKCVECGFLAVRDGELQLIEVDVRGRSQWTFPDWPLGKPNQPVVTAPVCAVGAADLAGEARSSEANAVLPVIGQDRPCKKYYKWHPQYSPKEHQGMMQLDEQRRTGQVLQIAGIIISALCTLVGVLIGKLMADPQPPPIVNIHVPAQEPKEVAK